jgi:hypothetical protein
LVLPPSFLEACLLWQRPHNLATKQQVGDAHILLAPTLQDADDGGIIYVDQGLAPAGGEEEEDEGAFEQEEAKQVCR